MRRGNSDLLSVAPLSMALMGINIALFIYCTSASGGMQHISSDVLYALGMSQRERLWEGEWFRLIMPNFLHGGLLHILLNSYMLYRYGPAAEVHFGTSNFGTLYLLSGVGGFACSEICGGNRAIGASAALFGLMGAYLAIKVLEYPVLKNAWKGSDVRDVAFWIAINFGIGIMGMMGPIDNWGHLGGLIFGIALGSFFELWRKQRRFGLPLVIAMVLFVALSVGAARWTIFSPYYHIHMAAIATEEEKNPAAAEAEFTKALAWAKFWHKEEKVANVIDAYRAGEWDLNTARQQLYLGIEWRFGKRYF